MQALKDRPRAGGPADDRHDRRAAACRKLMALPWIDAPPFSRHGMLDRAAIRRFASRADRRVSTSARPDRRRAPARSPAAICRRRCSPARSPATRRSCSPRSRRAASTSARRSSSTASSWRFAPPAAPCFVISEDLEEMFALSDRIAVMYRRPHHGRHAGRRGDGGTRRPLDGGRRGERGMIRVRLERRQETPLWLQIAIPIAAVIVTLILCSGLVALSGANVVEAYRLLLFSTFRVRLRHPGHAGEGGAAALHRPRRPRRLPRQILEHRRGGPAHGRRHRRLLHRRARMAAGRLAWCR